MRFHDLQETHQLGDSAFRRQVHLTKSGETPTLAAALPGAGNDLLVFGDRGVGHQAP